MVLPFSRTAWRLQVRGARAAHPRQRQGGRPRREDPRGHPGPQVARTRGLSVFRSLSGVFGGFWVVWVVRGARPVHPRQRQGGVCKS